MIKTIKFFFFFTIPTDNIERFTSLLSSKNLSETPLYTTLILFVLDKNLNLLRIFIFENLETVKIFVEVLIFKTLRNMHKSFYNIDITI